MARTKAGDQVVLCTRDGMSIRFDESRRALDGPAGLRRQGDRPADGDEVVGMVVANGDEDPASLLTVCANGYGKRTLLTEYRTQNRGGKGLIDIQTSDRNGSGRRRQPRSPTTTRSCSPPAGGIVIRTQVARYAPIGRNTQGVRLIKLDEGDTVSSLAKLPEEELTDRCCRSSRPIMPDGDLEPTRWLVHHRLTSSTTAWPRPRPATIIDADAVRRTIGRELTTQSAVPKMLAPPQDGLPG